MAKILILDDMVVRHKSFQQRLIGHVVTHTYTVKDTIKALEEDSFDFVYLDHDLNGKVYVPSGPGTGYEVAQWLVDHPEKQPEKICVHSLNEKGRQAIALILPQAIMCPGAWNTVCVED